jgi:hypothetical protein
MSDSEHDESTSSCTESSSSDDGCSVLTDSNIGFPQYPSSGMIDVKLSADFTFQVILKAHEDMTLASFKAQVDRAWPVHDVLLELEPVEFYLNMPLLSTEPMSAVLAEWRHQWIFSNSYKNSMPTLHFRVTAWPRYLCLGNPNMDFDDGLALRQHVHSETARQHRRIRFVVEHSYMSPPDLQVFSESSDASLGIIYSRALANLPVDVHHRLIIWNTQRHPVPRSGPINEYRPDLLTHVLRVRMEMLVGGAPKRAIENNGCAICFDEDGLMNTVCCNKPIHYRCIILSLLTPVMIGLEGISSRKNNIHICTCISN